MPRSAPPHSSHTEPASPVAASAPRADATVHVTWTGAHRFDGGRPGGPAVTMDSSGQAGPSPVDMLLNALAGCVSVDVLDILEKRRTPVTALTVQVIAQRADTIPRYVTHARLAFTITGNGIERHHAERAIDLAVTKYCSVRDSLRPDTTVDWTLTLLPSSDAPAARNA